MSKYTTYKYSWDHYESSSDVVYTYSDSSTSTAAASSSMVSQSTYPSTFNISTSGRYHITSSNSTVPMYEYNFVVSKLEQLSKLSVSELAVMLVSEDQFERDIARNLLNIHQLYKKTESGS